MILYCKDSLGCIDNNNIELINNVWEHVFFVPFTLNSPLSARPNLNYFLSKSIGQN